MNGKAVLAFFEFSLSCYLRESHVVERTSAAIQAQCLPETKWGTPLSRMRASSSDRGLWGGAEVLAADVGCVVAVGVNESGDDEEGLCDEDASYAFACAMKFASRCRPGFILASVDEDSLEPLLLLGLVMRFDSRGEAGDCGFDTYEQTWPPRSHTKHCGWRRSHLTLR